MIVPLVEAGSALPTAELSCGGGRGARFIVGDGLLKAPVEVIEFGPREVLLLSVCPESRFLVSLVDVGGA